MVHAELGDPDLAGVAEPTEDAGICEGGGLRDSVFVVFVQLDPITGMSVSATTDPWRSAKRWSALFAVRSLRTRRSGRRRRAVHIAPQHDAARVIFGDQFVAVVEKPYGAEAAHVS